MTDDLKTSEPEGVPEKPVAKLAHALAQAQEVARSASTPDPLESSLRARIDSLDSIEPESKSTPSPQRKRRLWPIQLVMVVLIVCVPVLVTIGYQQTSRSTSGDVIAGTGQPGDPGFTALATPTPVALVVMKGSSGEAESLAILSLGGANHHGGAVITVPVATRLSKARYGIRSFAGIFKVNRLDTAGKVVGNELGLGFSDVIEVADAELIKLLEPVAPLTINVPVDVTTPAGTFIDAGRHEFTADEIPGFLAATDSTGSIDAQMQRQGLVWKAWITAIAKSPGASIPGETSSGLGFYLSSLAQGDVATTAMPSVPTSPVDGQDTVKVDTESNALLIANSVPFPVGAVPGARTTVTLLNGTSPDAAPLAAVQRLTFAGAQILTVGNANRFDIATTTLTYANPKLKKKVQAMAKWLGAGKLVLDRHHPGTSDVTIVMGRDLLASPPRALSEEDVTQ